MEKFGSATLFTRNEMKCCSGVAGGGAAAHQAGWPGGHRRPQGREHPHRLRREHARRPQEVSRPHPGKKSEEMPRNSLMFKLFSRMQRGAL
jgi:hypothetical protein